LPLHYRPAQATDALTLSVLAMQVFLDTYATAGINADLAREATTVYALEVFQQRLASKEVEIILATQDDRLIGFVDLDSATQCPVMGAGAQDLEVFRLYVQRPFLRQGVGRRLMQEAERVASLRHRECLWLTAWAGNTRALCFYQAMGYTDVGSTEYVIEGKGYENRVLRKRMAVSCNA
jgi:ribosomal protein S18 acetylase RimI-like enzyme